MTTAQIAEFPGRNDRPSESMEFLAHSILSASPPAEDLRGQVELSLHSKLLERRAILFMEGGTPPPVTVC